MPRTAEVGPAVFKRVNELVEAEGISKADAFEKVGKERDMNKGTVSANYYRIARQEGGRPNRRRSRAQAKSNGNGNGGTQPKATRTPVEGTAQSVMDAVTQLVRENQDQARKIEQLQAKLDGLRSLIEA